MSKFNNNQLVSISQALFPYAEQRRQAFYEGMKLAHYTSADAAYAIIDKEKIWMRRATAMNDFREIEYGRYVLENTLSSEDGHNYQKFIQSLFPNYKFDILEELRNIHTMALSETYINCLSEHMPEEDTIGRLSMWRAYGGQTGVAIIVKPAAIQTQAAVGVISSPVYYPKEDTIKDQIIQQIKSISSYIDFIKHLEADFFYQIMRTCLKLAMISIKHRGFQEEREWRIAFEPMTNDLGLVTQITLSVRGAPQLIKLLNIGGLLASSRVRMGLDNIISHVIIGPTNYPEIIRDAFIDLFKQKGLENADNRVIISNIPLRYY